MKPGLLGTLDTMGAVIDVSDATFQQEVIEQSQWAPVVVDFWAAWCGPCRALGPILEEIAQRSPKVTLAKLDVDANPRTQQRYGVRGIPAVKAFAGGKLVDEFVGAQSRQLVEQFFARLEMAVEELPGDETGLRELLGRAPDRTDARRTLARLLLRDGRLDDATTVLAPAAHDPGVDGLLARAELQREAHDALPAALAAPDGAEELDAVPDVIAAIRSRDGAVRAQLRRVAVGVLAEHADDPRVGTLRGDLSSALF